ncbi:MAG: type II secretion system F family protein [Candidatus Woesearchaeota archaeon]|nr:type II secretion system F family protein [Candidatus Woesearchaeota archaeon]
MFFLVFIFLGFFFFFLHAPDVKIMKEKQEIGKEIIFAGRFLMVELESGIDVYNSMIGVAQNYETIGKYMRHIIKQIDLGTPIEDAINEEVELTPSDDLRKILWQILNSLRTGADASKSLRSVIEQIVKEQHISITEYGRKLNPLAMFYMIIAIILPTLGVTMTIVLSTLMSIPIDFKILMVFLMFVAFMQFMFLSIIRSSRPAVGI